MTQYTAKVEANSLLSLPKEAHEELGLKPGDLVDIIIEREEIETIAALKRGI
jgi:AbrB family looped-hinge helix DNA binding protein